MGLPLSPVVTPLSIVGWCGRDWSILPHSVRNIDPNSIVGEKIEDKEAD